MGRVDTGGGRGSHGLVAGGIVLAALIGGGLVAGLPQAVPHDIELGDIDPSGTAPADAPLAAVAPGTPTTPPRAPETTTRVADVATATPSTTPAARRPAAIRVVVADAAGSDGLAAEVAEAARAQGHVDVVVADAVARRAASVVYHAVDHAREGQRLADALGIGATAPLPVDPITVDGAPADLWVVVGADRP